MYEQNMFHPWNMQRRQPPFQSTPTHSQSPPSSEEGPPGARATDFHHLLLASTKTTSETAPFESTEHKETARGPERSESNVCQPNDRSLQWYCSDLKDPALSTHSNRSNMVCTDHIVSRVFLLKEKEGQPERKSDVESHVHLPNRGSGRPERTAASAAAAVAAAADSGSILS